MRQCILPHIQLIATSLEAHKGEHAGLFAVRRLLRRIDTFGFHFLTLLAIDAAERVYGEEGKQLQVPGMIRFASWVGGDMDGNPNVNAKTIRSTLARQRSLILDLYYRECGGLSAKLSQSSRRIDIDEMIQDKIEHYRNMFQNAYHAVPARHREPEVVHLFTRTLKTRPSASMARKVNNFRFPV